jgi:hypothetical protein
MADQDVAFSFVKQLIRTAQKTPSGYSDQTILNAPREKIMKTTFIAEPNPAVVAAAFLFLLFDSGHACAQAVDGVGYRSDSASIRTDGGPVATHILSIAADPPFERGVPAKKGGSSGSDRAQIPKRPVGTELIPYLDNVIPNLPPLVQPGLRNDPKIRQCIAQTNNYNSDVYNIKIPNNSTANTIFEHDKECLSPFPPKSSVFTLNSDFSAVGVLYSLNKKSFYCTATLISNDLLITARHCAYLPSGDANVGVGVATEDEGGYSLNSPSDIVFYSIAKPLDPIHIASFVDQNEGKVNLPSSLPSLDQENDIVFMKLQRSLTGISPASLGGSPPATGQQMIIPGFYARLAILDGLPQTLTDSNGVPTSAKLAGWTTFMRYDALNTCKIVQAGKQCIFHGCQTEPGWSGAPVFVDGGNGNGPLVVSGIQSGSLSDNSDCRSELNGNNKNAFGANSDIPNVAIIVVKH